MIETVITARLQMRNDTAARWVTYNPVLLIGEIGVESDGGKFKIGDGVTAWKDLVYMVYTHPTSHPAVMIVQDSGHLFVTDEEKGVWDDAASEIGAHLLDDAAHSTAADQMKWNDAASEIGAHLLDSTSHITSEDQTKWDGAADSIGEIGAVLDAINGEVV